MSAPADEYKLLLEKLRVAQEGSEEENALLDRLDVLWYREMSEQDRQIVNAWTSERARGEQA